jgi:hypothetical protein
MADIPHVVKVPTQLAVQMEPDEEAERVVRKGRISGSDLDVPGIWRPPLILEGD